MKPSTWVLSFVVGFMGSGLLLTENVELTGNTVFIWGLLLVACVLSIVEDN